MPMKPQSSSFGSRRPTALRFGLVLALLVIPLAIAACGREQQLVCNDDPEHLVVVPSTSESEYETSRELTPDIAEQALERAAESCGRLTVGVMTSNPERDLELRSLELEPERERVYNREAVIRQQVEDGEGWIQENLLDPLEQTQPSVGSPFLGAYAKIGRELRAHDDWESATVISIGDGLAAERSPSGARIRFGKPAVSEQALDEFIPPLRPLRGSCVLLIGVGGTDNAGLPPQRVRNAQRLLGQTLNSAGVGFVATRSPDLPSSCTKAGAS